MGVVLARPIVLFLLLFWLAGAFSFRKDYSPPLVRHLDPKCGIRAWSLIYGLHRPERMANYELDVECPHIFEGTHFARWRNWMTCNVKFISPQMWWIIDVGFPHAIDRKDATQAQKKCLHLDCQATNIFYQSMKDNTFGEIMDMKSAHEIWIYLNKKYGPVFDDDDDDHKDKAHGDVA